MEDERKVAKFVARSLRAELFAVDVYVRHLIFGGDGIVTQLSHELAFAAARLPSSS
jgi:hypothetical protein